MKKNTKRILALVIGFAFAMIIMCVGIYFGYTNAYKTDVDLFTVKILGLPIYELSKKGAEYVGRSKGIYMGMFCGICMVIAVAIETMIGRLRRK